MSAVPQTNSLYSDSRHFYASFECIVSCGRAVDELLQNGTKPDEISVLLVNHGELKDERSDIHHQAKAGVSVVSLDKPVSSIKRGAAVGLGVGAAAALATIAIPGVGLLIGSGVMTAALTALAGGVGTGAAAGAAVGLVGGTGTGNPFGAASEFLAHQGFSEAQIGLASHIVKEGGALVAVTYDGVVVTKKTLQDIVERFGGVERIPNGHIKQGDGVENRLDLDKFKKGENK